LAFSRLERGLNVDAALDGVHHAGKLGQHAIAGRVNKSPPMLLDQTVDDRAVRGQTPQRRLLIFPHEAAITVDVGAQNRGELAFHTHLLSQQFYG